MHLKIVHLNGVWQSVGVYLLDALGYGTYTVQVSSDLDSLDQSTVACPIFLYASDTQEFDNEYSGLGGMIAAPYTAQFVVQPAPYVPLENVVQYIQPSTARFTTQMEWSASKIVFQSWNGWATSPAPGDIIQRWTYTGAHVPPPVQANVRINLWLHRGAAPVSGVGDAMVIRSFAFQRGSDWVRR